MAVTAKWRQHIEAWQHSGLSQAKYCAEQQINVGTFTARLCDYRKLPKTSSAALIPVAIEPSVCGCGHCLHPCPRSSLGVACFGVSEVASGAIAMPG